MKYQTRHPKSPTCNFRVFYNKHMLDMDDLTTLDGQNWLNDQVRFCCKYPLRCICLKWCLLTTSIVAWNAGFFGERPKKHQAMMEGSILVDLWLVADGAWMLINHSVKEAIILSKCCAHVSRKVQSLWFVCVGKNCQCYTTEAFLE